MNCLDRYLENRIHYPQDFDIMISYFFTVPILKNDLAMLFRGDYNYWIIHFFRSYIHTGVIFLKLNKIA